MPALAFVRTTLLDPRSPACLWRHPVMALRVVAGATENALLPLGEKVAVRALRECPVCRWRGHRFRNFLSADEVIRHCICPGCGSFDRHRQLVLGVREELRRLGKNSPDMMVGFSLSTAMRYVLEHEGLARCFRSDIDADEKRFAPDFTADLRQAPLKDASVDWVFCSHVLEHIPELELCIDEILRILRPGGAAWIQVPFEPGLAHSRRIPVDPHRAHAHAWQFAPDFPHLIARDGWKVTEVVAGQQLGADQLRRCSIDPLERYWLARKHG
ncbi:MAG TPA: class I SAM-dependent methyltransferase [Candidatus Krumholzibacteria bacterium]|nr:class I SAM-dependent methyltransferase [Candidatus Krumholzibacteria bacterium]